MVSSRYAVRARQSGCSTDMRTTRSRFAISPTPLTGGTARRYSLLSALSALAAFSASLAAFSASAIWRLAAVA